ncbi:MAG TPA: hypothetical protein VFS04_05375 [Alphaproteobacteria bacterium]|nr:hypothetical protein [Alphaproteobacteria bacterium]
MFKKIAIAVVVLLVIVAGGAYFLLSNIDGLIKNAMEKYGSEATQASVKVGGVKIGLRDGSGQITNISIGNPKGFTSPEAFTLGEVKVVIDPASVTGKVIHIKEVVIDKPQVYYEPNLGGSGNLETIQKNVNGYAAKMGGGSSSSSGGASAPSASSAPKDEKKFIIDRVTIQGGKVSVKSAALAQANQNVYTDLPAINLRDIGKAKGGATPAEVSSEIIGAISQQASRAAANNLGNMLQGLGGSGSTGGGAADQLRGLLGR